MDEKKELEEKKEEKELERKKEEEKKKKNIYTASPLRAFQNLFTNIYS